MQQKEKDERPKQWGGLGQISGGAWLKQAQAPTNAMTYTSANLGLT